MDYQGKPCLVEVWDASQAAVKASFDLTPIMGEFMQTLVNQLAKYGVSQVQSSPDPDIIVRGKYIRIDAGSQAMRYLLTFFAGKATMQVEGELVLKGRGSSKLSARSNQSWGVFGGNSQNLLKNCAKNCASTIAGQVVSVLKQA
jgi:hypothetical protein